MRPGVVGAYPGSASASGYSVDGVPLNLSEKDQKWLGIRESLNLFSYFSMMNRRNKTYE